MIARERVPDTPMLDRTGGTGTGHVAIGVTVDFRPKSQYYQTKPIAAPRAPVQSKTMLANPGRNVAETISSREDQI